MNARSGSNPSEAVEPCEETNNTAPAGSE